MVRPRASRKPKSGKTRAVSRTELIPGTRAPGCARPPRLQGRAYGILERMSPDAQDDLVVILDEHGSPCGTAPRASVHQRQTPLHLGFSCHITRSSGEVLVTRRALTKATWPGVWTNSCCGHPRPDENVEVAVARRVREELGLDLVAIKPLIPTYRYTAADASWVMENEVCPVYLGIAAEDDVHPDPREVAEHRWTSWEALGAVAANAPWLLSPWSSEQIAIMRR